MKPLKPALSDLRARSVSAVESEREILRAALDWQRRGRAVMLATVVRTWGSAPRPPGSMLAIASDGALVGSVSGGCIEDDLHADWLAGAIDRHRPSLREYGVNADDAHRFGLPCGGTIVLAIEPVGPASALTELLAMLEAHPLVERQLDLDSGAVRHRTATGDRTIAVIDRNLIACYGRTHRLLLIGAGQPSAFIASNALALGYDVTVCEPRAERIATWAVPGAALRGEMPDDVVIDMALDERSAVIALTHDPKLDDLALMEALKRPVFYAGAIGSRRSDAARRERLKLFGVDAAMLARLRGPAGLYIGASTPLEIGLSILADLTAHRRGVPAAATLSVAAGKALCET